MFRRRDGRAAQVVRAGDLIPDNRLLPNETDLLEHEAIAKGVAEIALNAKSPVNIALFGAWGSGKSSVYTMVEKHLADITSGKVKIARYDAWKYGGKDLKRNFIDSIAQDLELASVPELSTGLDRTERETRLDLGGWLRRNWGSLLLGLAFAVVVGAVWVSGISLATKVFTEDAFKETAKSLIPEVGTVFGLALIAVLVGPRVLEGATVTTETPAPKGADQFAKRFEKLVDRARKGSAHPLVVFIDELDRCSPSDVVSTLIDLKTFLDQPNCAFIVAADREVIVRALREEVPQAKPIREDEPYYATPGAFLDKIFQHQIALPPLRARALTQFARDLADAQDGGVWADLRAAEADCYDRAIFALVPVHVRSPRRVKVLLNNFATNARIAESRGIPWLDRVHEIAVLTVLQTEFPTVVGDLRRVPRLLTYLRRTELPSSPEVSEIVDRYALVDLSVPSEVSDEAGEEPNTAGDELIADDMTPRGKQEQRLASETLRRHLSGYLGKVDAAGMQDPRPDLLYLKPAANRDLLPDPKLGDAIDLAADTAPDQVVDVFDGQNSKTLAIAIPLLVVEGDNAISLGRRFAYESACRLVERLDPDDIHGVAAETSAYLVSELRSARLSSESMPGALLVAALSNSQADIHSFLSSADAAGLSENLLERLTRVLPYLKEAEAALVVDLLARRFGSAPEPLLRALLESPVETACELWASVSGSVIQTLNALELPEAKSDEERRTQPAAAQATPSQTAQPTTPAGPEPTGEGVALLDRLMEVATGRGDGEPLVSDVLASFQAPPASRALILWTTDNADRLVAPMDSEERKARHALLGLRHHKSGAWALWGELLPETPARGVEEDEAVTEMARELVREQLLPAFESSQTALVPADLADLTRRVASWWVVDDEQLAESAQRIFADMAWEEDSGEDALESLWARKKALYQVVLDLAHDRQEDGQIPTAVVDDLGALLESMAVDMSLVNHVADMCEFLPTSVCRSFSERVDAYDVRSGEEAAALQLKLLVRHASDGKPPAASELAALQKADRTTAHSDAWLALGPTVGDVVTLLDSYAFTGNALGSYSDELGVEERSSLWVESAKAGLSDVMLRAIGRSGVGPGAVEHCGVAIAGLSQEPKRRDQVRRLRLATPAVEPEPSAAVRRAAGHLAEDLLNRDVSGDVRSAAEVMCWAGGAAHGAKTELRVRFDQQVKKHKGAVTKTLFDEMRSLGLLSKKQSLWDIVFGRSK